MDYLDYLINQYVERMDFLTKGIATGNLTSFDEYKYVCGQLRGLEAACVVIKDLKDRLENSDNE